MQHNETLLWPYRRQTDVRFFIFSVDALYVLCIVFNQHWNADLANVAQQWTDQCTEGHDDNYQRRKDVGK